MRMFTDKDGFCRPRLVHLTAIWLHRLFFLVCDIPGCWWRSSHDTTVIVKADLACECTGSRAIAGGTVGVQQLSDRSLLFPTTINHLFVSLARSLVSTAIHSNNFLLEQGQFQAEGAAGRPAGGAARSSLVAGLKKRDSQPHSRWSGTAGTGNEKRCDTFHNDLDDS